MANEEQLNTLEATLILLDGSTKDLMKYDLLPYYKKAVKIKEILEN